MGCGHNSIASKTSWLESHRLDSSIYWGRGQRGHGQPSSESDYSLFSFHLAELKAPAQSQSCFCLFRSTYSLRSRPASALHEDTTFLAWATSLPGARLLGSFSFCLESILKFSMWQTSSCKTSVVLGGACVESVESQGYYRTST